MWVDDKVLSTVQEMLKSEAMEQPDDRWQYGSHVRHLNYTEEEGRDAQEEFIRRG